MVIFRLIRLKIIAMALLSGEELIGISIWFDKNSNGVSEPGKMMELKTLGVLSIGTIRASEMNGLPMHEKGVTLVNGKTLRTYDWITTPVKKKLVRSTCFN